MPVTSSSVGTMSITWWNCQRTPPLSVMWPGQEIAMPWRVPPKNDGTCLVHLYGVSNAQAQGTAKWLYAYCVPHTS